MRARACLRACGRAGVSARCVCVCVCLGQIQMTRVFSSLRLTEPAPTLRPCLLFGATDRQSCGSRGKAARAVVGEWQARAHHRVGVRAAPLGWVLQKKGCRLWLAMTGPLFMFNSGPFRVMSTNHFSDGSPKFIAKHINICQSDQLMHLRATSLEETLRDERIRGLS